LQGELDEMCSEAHLADEKSKKAMVDAARYLSFQKLQILIYYFYIF
jgi:hypothetical protein